MTRPALLVSAISFGFLLTPAAHVRGSHDDPASWLELLDDHTYEAAGLTKLTGDELAVLGDILVRPAGPSFLEMEAMKLAEQAGWRPVQVAAILAGTGTRRLLLVGDEGVVLAKAWSSIDALPSPGTHWAKNTLGSWDIVHPDGKARYYRE